MKRRADLNTSIALSAKTYFWTVFGQTLSNFGLIFGQGYGRGWEFVWADLWIFGQGFEPKFWASLANFGNGFCVPAWFIWLRYNIRNLFLPL